MDPIYQQVGDGMVGVGGEVIVVHADDAGQDDGGAKHDAWDNGKADYFGEQDRPASTKQPGGGTERL